MKKNYLLLVGVLAIIALSAGCTPAAAPVIPPAAVSSGSQNPVPVVQSASSASDAISVVKAYMDTANTGDFNKTLAFYADDAVVYNPLGVFVGKDEISKWLTNDVQTTRVTPSDVKMQGSMVVVTGMVSLDRFQKASIGEVAFQAVYMVDNGKIRFFSPTVQLTPGQQATMAAIQADAPAAPAPAVNPEDIAKAYVAAANSGDFNTAISFYAEDAAALVMNNTLLLSGKSQISGWLQSDVQTTRASAQDWKMNGNVVINTGMVSLARFTKLGINEVQYQSIYVIQNGKIRLFWPTLLMTPEQQAILQAAQPAPTKTP
jgi:ketosteroid isomerase-like protein